MKNKIFVVIATVVMLALSVSAVSAEDQNKNSGDIIGTYKGVDAYSNGDNTGTGEGTYQCVQYIKRFYQDAIRVSPKWNGNAITYYTNAEDKGLISYPNNGLVAPKPDDIIIFGGSKWGHVAIITEVGDDYVKIIEQNWNRNNAYATLSLERDELKNYNILPRGSKKRPIEGWCRTPTLNIISPTKESFSSVGDYDKPNLLTVNAEVKSENAPIIGLNKDNFTIEIGSKKVNDVTINDVGEGRYKLSFNPPKQDSNGDYDLNIDVKYKKVILSDSEKAAVRYGEDNVNANVMLVIDRSGSMYGSPISNARNSAQQFIDQMGSEDKAGVVSFSSYASKDYPLTALNDDERELIKKKINSISASGSTAIGSGLELALNDLQDNGDKNSHQAIVLLSDGQQNTGKHPNEVIPSIKANNIQVYTIGLGSVDEILLKSISTETGGTYTNTFSESELNKIYSDIGAEILDLDTAKKLTFNMVTNDVMSTPVEIDSTVEKASFGTSWPGSNVDLVLYKPDGSIVDPSMADSDPAVEYLSGPTYKIYKVTDPQPGEWTMELTATDMPTEGEDVYVTVRAVSTLSMLLSTDKDQYNQGESVKIVADLSEAETQITAADVEANITLPDSGIEKLTLYDDGSHGDGRAKDGVYANFFANTSLMGDYTVEATSTGSLFDGTQFNRIEDTSFEIAQGTDSISLLPENLSIEEKPGEQITRNITISTSSDSTWVTITPTQLLSRNGDIIDTSTIGINPTSVNVSSGEPENILITINIPESTTFENYTGQIIATGVNGSDSCTVNLHVTNDAVTDDIVAPVINSVGLYPANSTPGSVISVTVNVTDDVGVSGVKVNGISLLNQDGNFWTGDITALEGTCSVNVSTMDEAGNIAWDNSTSYTALKSGSLPLTEGKKVYEEINSLVCKLVYKESKPVYKEPKLVDIDTKQVCEKIKTTCKKINPVCKYTEEVSEDSKQVSKEAKLVCNNTKEVSEETEIASENTENLSEVIKEVSENTEIANESTKNLSEDIKEVSEDTGTVSEDIEEVSEDAEEVSENIETVSEDIGEVSEDTEEVSENIETVSEDIGDVSEDTGTVDDTEIVSEDTETASEDTEIVSEDTETVSEDTGMVDDTETVSEDTGAVDDTETVSEDTGAVDDTETASEDTEIVSEDTGMVENTETVSEDTGTADDTETASEDTETASEDTETVSEES